MTQAQIEQAALDATAADLIRRAAVLDHLASQLEVYSSQLARRERDIEMRERDLIKASKQIAAWRKECKVILQRGRDQKRRSKANAA